MDPERAVTSIGAAEADRPLLASLKPDDLEFQAEVLLRKRWSAVRVLMPDTVARLAEDGWRRFRSYARLTWPEGRGGAEWDAARFCDWLRRVTPDSLNVAESNRVRFASGSNCIKLSWAPDLKVRGRVRSGWQVFLRTSRKRRELLLWFGF